MKLIEAGNYEKDNPPPLPPSASNGLCNWLKRLPSLAADLPSISQVHGYSGIWNVQNRFKLWRGLPVDEGDDIFFDGKTVLFLPIDGKGGSGIQIGHLYVFVANYSATYQIVNEVLQADVDEKGTLEMRVKVIRRNRIEEYGEPPSNRYRTELANKEFTLVLDVAKEPMSLEGTHKYERANRLYQESVENYKYQGLFRPPGL